MDARQVYLCPGCDTVWDSQPYFRKHCGEYVIDLWICGVCEEPKLTEEEANKCCRPSCACCGEIYNTPEEAAACCPED